MARSISDFILILFPLLIQQSVVWTANSSSPAMGINGFGKTGRTILRAKLERNYSTRVSAINDPFLNPQTMADMMKSELADSNFNGDIRAESGALIINGNRIEVFSESDPAKVPWGRVGATFVAETTGRFTTTEQASAFLRGGAKKVIITGRSADAPLLVYGVNENTYNRSMDIVSVGTSTTNCLAVAAKVLNDNFGIREGVMTSVYAKTTPTQRPGNRAPFAKRDLRTAIQNIVPRSTDSAKDVGKVIPSLNGKIDGIVFEVSSATEVSVMDFTVSLSKNATYDEITLAMETSANGTMKGILGYTKKVVDSGYFANSKYSAILAVKKDIPVDLDIDEITFIYDNEYGHACRVVELLEFMKS